MACLTPLHWAVKCGHEIIVKMLLDYGAEGALPNRNGISPMCLAIIHDRVEIIDLFLQTNADSFFCGDADARPLELAVKHSRREVVLLLLKRGASPGSQQLEHNTLLQRLIRISSSPAQVSSLIPQLCEEWKSWKSLHVGTQEGRSSFYARVLSCAFDLGNLYTTAMLLDAEATVDRESVIVDTLFGFLSSEKWPEGALLKYFLLHALADRSHIDYTACWSRVLCNAVIDQDWRIALRILRYRDDAKQSITLPTSFDLVGSVTSWVPRRLYDRLGAVNDTLQLEFILKGLDIQIMPDLRRALDDYRSQALRSADQAILRVESVEEAFY